MKSIPLFLFLLLSISFCSAQSPDSLQSWFYQAFDLAKEHSLYADEVNWDSLETVLDPLVQEVKTTDDLRIALVEIINTLRDHHGRFLWNFQRFANMTDYSNTRKKDNRSSSMAKWNTVNVDNGGHAFEMVDQDIGYIRIVGVGPQEDINAVGTQIRNGLVSLAKKGVKKWVLDLRYNGGGNMYPMLEGLAPLLGDGVIGGAKMRDGQRVAWHIQNGNFCRGEYCPIQLPLNPEIESHSKVVVLISRYTVSSGEVVATSFKGRKNTHFIGEATGGYVTETNWQSISDELVMSIAVSRYMDRWGNVYYENIPPDEEVTFVPEKLLSDDLGVQAALKWFK